MCLLLPSFRSVTFGGLDEQHRAAALFFCHTSRFLIFIEASSVKKRFRSRTSWRRILQNSRPARPGVRLTTSRSSPHHLSLLQYSHFFPFRFFLSALPLYSLRRRRVRSARRRAVGDMRRREEQRFGTPSAPSTRDARFLPHAVQPASLSLLPSSPLSFSLSSLVLYSIRKGS